MNGIKTSLVTSWDEFSGVEKKWEELLLISPGASPFLSYLWLSTWWQVYGSDQHQLAIILIFQDDNLIGGIPWYVRRIKIGPFVLREVRFIGTGEPEKDEVMSEYLDLIYDVDFEEAVVGALHKIIKDDVFKADVYSFNRLLETNFVTKAFRSSETAETESFFYKMEYQNGYRYLLELDRGYEEFLKGMPNSRRKRMQQLTRRTYRDYTVNFRSADSYEEAVDMFDALCELHNSRWHKVGEAGAFSSEKFMEFHKKILKLFYQEGFLHMHVLEIDGEPISALYNYNFNGIEYYYQTGVNTSEYRKLSPGMVILGKSIELAFDNGRKIYDMMQAPEDSYKLDYGCKTEKMVESFYFSKKIMPTMVFLVLKFINKEEWLTHRSRVLE